MKTFFFLLALFFYWHNISAQTIDIIHCDNLTSIKLNNQTVVYNLTTSLDCMTQTSFRPIGNDSMNSFQGQFLGNGFTISNLIINVLGEINAGFFGYIKNSNITNLNLDHLNLTLNNINGNAHSNFIGYSENSIVSDIQINNSHLVVNDMNTANKTLYLGTSVGRANNSTLRSISINNAQLTSSNINQIFAAFVGMS